MPIERKQKNFTYISPYFESINTKFEFIKVQFFTRLGHHAGKWKVNPNNNY